MLPVCASEQTTFRVADILLACPLSEASESGCLQSGCGEQKRSKS
jgi:hypothetical protein